MSRNFGISDVRAVLGGQATARTSTRDTQRDSQSSDLEFGALIFALVCFSAPIFAGAFFLTIYFAFFE